MNDEALIAAVETLLATTEHKHRTVTVTFKHFAPISDIDNRPRGVIDAERIERGLQPLGEASAAGGRSTKSRGEAW